MGSSPFPTACLPAFLPATAVGKNATSHLPSAKHRDVRNQVPHIFSRALLIPQQAAHRIEKDPNPNNDTSHLKTTAVRSFLGTKIKYPVSTIRN